ncbi:MAG: LamG domain-containing protein, partial [Spirochaetia bacterium]|nr:LamG domain-containing protein [Spirochaetia bacterium]
SLSRQRIAGKPHFDPGFKTPMPGLVFGENRSIQAAFWDKGGKNKFILDGKTEVGEGGWTHAVLCIDESRAKLFINVKLESEVPCGGGIGWSDTPFYIGRIRSEDKTFRGQIGEVRFYKEALGDSEILALYTKGRPLYPAPAVLETKVARVEQVSAKTSPKESWRDYPTRTLALLEGYSSTQDTGLDVWGGNPEKKYEARGFFYARQDEGRWHLVDPEGNYFIHVAVVAVAPGNTKSIRENFGKNFKSKEDWADQSTALLKSRGFNGTGAWSEVGLLRGAKTRLAYTVIKNFMSEFARTKNLLSASVGHSGYVKDSLPVFHPDFESFCAKYAEELRPTKDDPALLGIFSDNELLPPDLSKYLTLDPADKDQAPNYHAALAWLVKKTGKADAGTKDVTSELKREFMAYVFERYFAVVSAAIKAVDPNHLYIGSRFHASEKNNPLVWKAVGKYLDV